MNRALPTFAQGLALMILATGCEGLYLRPGDSGLDGGGADAGLDAGADAGFDAGTDAGFDAGFDAGADAGFDAGFDAGADAGKDAGVDAGTDAGFDAGPPSDGGPPVVPAVLDWSLKGSLEEYAIGAAPSGSNILWVRYVTGTSGKITTLNRANGALVSTQLTDLGPLSIASWGDSVALVGAGVQSVSDWHVQWLSPAGVPISRGDTMNLVDTGGSMPGAMYPEPDGGLTVQVIAPKASTGIHVSALTSEDGGVTRVETTCANSFWWDAATADNSNRRFFLGGVTLGTCDLGNGQYVGPSGGAQVQWVLARYQGVRSPGSPTVRTLTGASGTLKGPAALGANADSVWIAYPSPTGHLRLEHFSIDTVSSQLAVEATGQAYVTGQTELGLAVDDVIPNPTADRVYLLVNVLDSKCTWRSEPLPPLNAETIAVYTFDKAGNLLGVTWVASSNAPKSGSTMALIDDHLVISGQCLSTPAAGTTDPLCNPTATGFVSPFVFSIPAP